VSRTDCRKTPYFRQFYGCVKIISRKNRKIQDNMASIALLATQLGNRNAASDAGSAALLAEAAGKAAAYNVRINLPNIKDSAFAKPIKERMKNALALLEQKCRETECLMNDILA
jgi:formiminotetrahydrofolate cyclodeaminase